MNETHPLHLTVKSIEEEGIRVNQSIREGAFEVPVPPGAEVVVVEGKTTDREDLVGSSPAPVREIR